LIPPDNTNCNDYLRLEHITACYLSKLLCDHKFARRFLPNVPKKLFRVLMQTTMVEDFKTHLKIPSESINQLVLHWPYPEFNLREVFPILPPDNLDVTRWINDIIYELPYYYNSVVAQIITQAIEHQWEFEKTIHTVTKIDVTGHFSWSPNNYLDPRLIYSGCGTNAKECNKMYLCGDIQLVLDDWGHLTASNRVVDFSENNIGIGVTYNKAQIFSRTCKPDCYPLLVRTLVKNKPKYLKMLLTCYDETILPNICENVPQLEGLSIEMPNNLLSISCLSSLQNLQMLYISFMDLGGKLLTLCELQKGLLYLGIPNCNLTCEDLTVLLQSPHLASLRQLDLTGNSLGKQESFTVLPKLCSSMINVEVLELAQCELGTCSLDEIKLLIRALTSLQKLTILDLEANIFTVEDVKSEIINLKFSESLQCLTLSSPLQIWPRTKEIDE
ncbi:unnamed protein product, partial [Meganyctiphanes norvegica]